MPKLNFGLLSITLAATTWGSIGVAVAVLYDLTPTTPLSVSFWRLALSAPVLLLLSRCFVGPNFWRVATRDRLPLLIMGVAFAAYQVCYFAAIPHIGVAAAVLVNICSAPIFAAGLSGVFLGERLTWAVGLALAGAVTGAVLLVGQSPEAAIPSALLLGGALALGAGLSYALVALTARMTAARYHPIQPVTLAFTLSAVLLLPLALGAGLDTTYSAAGWGILLYLGVVPTAVGYGLYVFGLRTVTATVSTIFALLEPLISTLLAVTVLRERLSPGGVWGGALLLGSVAFLYWRQAAAKAAASGG
ncbi:MAG: EamA family transporter [Anaerolineales bacterium]|nr:EamA family transporter [Anaerolineales bacterium]